MLARARSDVVHPGHVLLPTVPMGTKDHIWMPIVGAMGLVVIIRDRKIRTKPVELAAFHAHKLRVFWITGEQDLTNWGYLERTVRHWKRIEDVIAARGDGPWCYGIADGGLAEIVLKAPA